MRFAVGCAIVLTLRAPHALAELPSASDECQGPSIVLEPPLSHRRAWQAAAGDTRKRMAELSDVDACTRLEVEQTSRAVRVRASVADGRSVVRALSGPGELEPTVVALLVLPPTERTEKYDGTTEDTTPSPSAVPKAAPPPAAPKPASPPSVTAKHEAHDEVGSAHLVDTSLSTHGFELALSGSGRAVGYLVGAGASVVMDWRLSGWLIGATAHAEQVTGPSTDPSHFSAQRSASLGALFGRRLVARPFCLDAAVEAPLLAVSTSQWTAHQTVASPSGGSESDDSGTGSDDPPTTGTPVSVTQSKTTSPTADLRAGALVRSVVPFSGRFGATLAADAEHSLGLLHETTTAGQPAALGWSFGVSLGVFWSPP